MSTSEIIGKIESLKEWEAVMEEASGIVEGLKDDLKHLLDEQGVEEYEAGTYIIRWTKTLSNRFDSTAFKRVMPDVYKAYTKQVTSRRFTVSG